jgi:hypothetical protein
MGHRGKDTTSPKVAVVDLQCSPLSNSLDRGHYLQVHLECLQHQLETIQLIGQTSPSSARYEQLLGEPGRPLISLPTKPLQPGAETRRTDVAVIANLPH